MDKQEINIKSSKMYNDAPKKDANRFNFEDYSDVISKIILDKQNRTPFSIAINGKWGRGKTTLMRTIQEELRKKSGRDGNRKVKSVWFDAWKYSETDSMLAALVLEIFEEMGRQGLINKLKFTLAGGGKEINIVKAAIDIVKTLGGGIPLLPEFDKWLEDPEYKKKLSFYDLFQDYMKTILTAFVLEKEDGQYNDKEGVLVIFIDDLDRCPPKQITKVLESINLFFDQDGCFFVFGTDISLISKAIDANYREIEGFSGIEYIKKMIQLQFDLPTIREDDIMEFMEKELGIEEQLKTYFGMITKGLESNQREIKRFLNSLNLMRMLGKSIFKEYEEELLIKWSILSFSAKDFIKEVNNDHELIIKMEEIARLERGKVEEYIENLDEPYKTLCKSFKKDERILNVLSGKTRFKDTDIRSYIFLSRIAPEEPGEPRNVEPELHDLLSKDLRKRRDAEGIFENMPESGQQAFINSVLSDLKNNDESKRMAATEVLKRIRNKVAVNTLIEMLEDDNAFVRQSAADLLGLKHDIEAVDSLIQVLKKDDEASVRKATAQALGKTKDIRAVDPLIEALKAEELKGNDAAVSKAIIDALGSIKDERAVDLLVEALNDEALKGNDPSICKAIIDALGNIKDRRAVNPLIKALKFKDKYVRLSAIYALVKIGGDGKAKEALIDLIKDKDDEVSEAARSAFIKIAP